MHQLLAVELAMQVLLAILAVCVTVVVEFDEVHEDALALLERRHCLLYELLRVIILRILAHLDDVDGDGQVGRAQQLIQSVLEVVNDAGHHEH